MDAIKTEYKGIIFNSKSETYLQGLLILVDISGTNIGLQPNYAMSYNNRGSAYSTGQQQSRLP